MKKSFVSIIVFLLSFSISAQDASHPSLLSISVLPGVSLPLGQSSTLFSLGSGISLQADYRLPFLPWVYIGGGLDYDFEPLLGEASSISVLSAGISAGVKFNLTPWLILKSGGSAGFFFGSLDAFTPTLFNPYLSASAGVFFQFGQFEFGSEASYRYLFGLYNGLRASLMLAYEIPVGKPPTIKGEPPPQKTTPLSVQMENFSFEDIFPVFHKYYDDHPLAKVIIHNNLDQTITDVKVSFFIQQYMDGPKLSPSLLTIKAGESTSVDLFAIFRPSILDITEATKVQVEVILEYKFNGETQPKQSMMQTVRVFDRNAMTWEDDRRVAAFVTAKDPSVLNFSKNVASMVKGKVNGTIDPNLLQAMGLHNALSVYGLSYSFDQNNSYAVSSKNKQAVDFLQFPRQTLEYKGGDCDDLSILYSALLESVGIETAFITIPGHILLAFSLGLSPDDARKSFSYPDEIIFINGKSWIPIEVTERGSFLKAWQTGAKEWRENVVSRKAALFPVYEAWKVYEPVGLPGTGTSVSLPPAEKVLNSSQEDVNRFIEREIFEKATFLQTQITRTQNVAKAVNELGILYARYGLYDKAQQEFEKTIVKQEYVPALINLGNIYYLQDQNEKALEFYERAKKVAPDNSRALLGVARTWHYLENYYQVSKVWNELKKADPDLAQQFSYLILKGEEASRAAAIAGVKGVVRWEEE